MQVRDDLRNGKANYSLKHLTNTLLRHPKDFYLAAAALLIEAKYLSKLNHPNIVKLKGLAMGSSKHGDATPGSRRYLSAIEDGEGQDGFESGQCDSYFIISERLTDTLDRRIRQWKKDQATHKQLFKQTSEQKIQTWRLMMRKTSYALQIANALHYMHQRNLLYRDLKVCLKDFECEYLVL
jgi:serine/threonine protein kinase